MPRKTKKTSTVKPEGTKVGGLSEGIILGILTTFMLIGVYNYCFTPEPVSQYGCYSHKDNFDTEAKVSTVDKFGIVTYTVETVDAMYNNVVEEHTRTESDFRSLYKKAPDCEHYRRLFYERLFNEVIAQRNKLINEKNKRHE